MSLLVAYRNNIKAFPVNGIAAREAAITCTGQGYLPWRDVYDNLVIVKCYYSPNAIGTII
jgi:hypothetical protein